MSVNKAAKVVNKASKPSLRPSSSSQRKTPIKNKSAINSIADSAQNLTSEAMGILFQSYFNYSLWQDNTSERIFKNLGIQAPPAENLKNFKDAEKTLNMGLNIFSLTNMLSLLPSMAGLYADGLTIQKRYNIERNKKDYNQDKLKIINQLIDARNNKAPTAVVNRFKNDYQAIENKIEKEQDTLDKAEKTAQNIRIGGASLSGIGGILSAGYVYNALKDPNKISNILSVINKNTISSAHQKTLDITQSGLKLFAIGTALNSISSLLQFTDYFQKKPNDKKAEIVPKDSVMQTVKNQILPATGQLISGLSTAKLLQSHQSWDAANMVTQGAMATGLGDFGWHNLSMSLPILNKALTLPYYYIPPIKTFMWGSAIMGIAGGVGSLIGAGISLYNQQKLHKEPIKEIIHTTRMNN